MGFKPMGVITTETPIIGAEFNVLFDKDTIPNVIIVPFSTTIGGGQRTVSVILSVDGMPIIGSVPITFAPGVDAFMTFGDGLPLLQVNGNWSLPIPRGFSIPRGSTMISSTVGMEAGDAYGEIVVYGHTSG